MQSAVGVVGRMQKQVDSERSQTWDQLQAYQQQRGAALLQQEARLQEAAQESRATPNPNPNPYPNPNPNPNPNPYPTPTPNPNHNPTPNPNPNPTLSRYVWLAGFYPFFHVWLNVLAELLTPTPTLIPNPTLTLTLTLI